MIIMCAGAGYLLESSEIKQVRELRTGPNKEYPIGLVLDAVCENPSWKRTRANRKDSEGNYTISTEVVRFTGDTKQGTATIQWIVEGEEPTFHWMQVDGQLLNPLAAGMFFNAACVKFESVAAD